MAKRFDFQQFNIGRYGEMVLVIQCSSVRYGDHVSQCAELRLAKATWRGYAQWYNRPWETYTYRNAIHALAKKLQDHGWRGVGNHILEWSRIHAKGEAEAAEKFISDFKSEWDKARPSLREAVAAGAPFETESEANFALAALKMGNILNSLG